MKDQTRQIFVQAIAIVGFLLMAFIPFFQGKSDVFFNLLTGREFLGYGLLIWVFYFNFFVLVSKLYFSKRYLIYIVAIFGMYLSF